MLDGDLSALPPLILLAVVTAAVAVLVGRWSARAAGDNSAPVSGDADVEDAVDGGFRNRLGKFGFVLFVGMFPALLLLMPFEAAYWLTPYVMGAGGAGFMLSFFWDSGTSNSGGEGGDGGE
ncbi:hypothetical protein AB0M72_13080 [Nocardiopsis dassonvillei]|uniref:hypothetical protein n=1 Tax=Nocardiopsis dassonvillei TaxID=2014 RepID=UPI00200E1F95|nr:hypothetical protein [Nocardiopsis dassonvillei]MCK9873284.1 hypothetical protein [Nocardiopsis dassonvillei]